MDERREAPSAARNREPILAVLRDRLSPNARVLEVASGTGEHALWFTRALPGVVWQPTDADAESLASIAAWRGDAGPNLLPPLPLDAARPEAWPALQADVVLVINMIHIAPWAATLGLVEGAARVLPEGGQLLLYGPFREAGAHTGEGNVAFDLDLRERDPAWGIRDLEAVAVAAAGYGLWMEACLVMPANNRMVAFRRRAGGPG